MTAPLKSFDRVADCYDETRAMPRDAEAAVAAGIVATLRALTPAPRLLEVGIGTGRIAVPLVEAGTHVVGIDIAPAMLARLRAKRPDIPVVRAEATQLPFRGRPFDAALFVHVLHLVPDAVDALRAAAAVVRPGGLIIHGRTDYTTNDRRRVLVRARELAHELGSVDLGSSDWHREANRAFGAHADEVGTTIREERLAQWIEHATARDLLTAFQNRVFSATWSIPDAAMPAIVSRLTAWAEAEIGDLDRSMATEVDFTLVTARLPG